MAAAVFAWGFGKYGQLGNGANATCELPQLVRLPSSLAPSGVSCGGHFTAILATEKRKKSSPDQQTAERSSSLGRVFACGWGKYGRLGTGSEEDQLTPRETCAPLEAVAISAGHWHACAVSRDGKLYSWGYNKHHGVLGQEQAECNPIPKPIPTPSGMRFSLVSCGYNYTAAVSEGGVVFTWGCGKYGTLGHGDYQDRLQPTAVEVMNEKRIVLVSSGFSHTALVNEDGNLFTCGKGSDGALGHGKDHSDKLVPTVVEALRERVKIRHSSCSQGEHHAHTLACSDEGEVWSWGDGYKGKLGLGNQESQDTPTMIDHAHFGSRVMQVACGGIHSAALTEDGDVFTWGCGSDGRLGHPEAKGHRYLFRSDIPRRVENLPKDLRAVQLACSYYHTAVLCVGKT